MDGVIGDNILQLLLSLLSDYKRLIGEKEKKRSSPGVLFLAFETHSCGDNYNCPFASKLYSAVTHTSETHPTTQHLNCIVNENANFETVLSLLWNETINMHIPWDFEVQVSLLEAQVSTSLERRFFLSRNLLSLNETNKGRKKRHELVSLL